jgi:transglutaminase/protease-like cytokinesis protein 3
VNKNVSWSSGDTSIATVDTTGLVTGVAEGSAVITVTTEDGGLTGTCTVTVSNVPVTGVNVSPISASINVDSTRQLTAWVYPSNAFNKNISWSSSDTSIATVDTTGLVTGVAEGSAIITLATDDGGFTATSDITVSVPTSLAAIESGQDISIFPVPFNNRLNIQFEEEPAEAVDILLLDVTGRIVRYKRAVSLNNQLEVTDLNEGLYLVKLIGNNINIIETVIKIN